MNGLGSHQLTTTVCMVTRAWSIYLSAHVCEFYSMEIALILFAWFCKGLKGFWEIRTFSIKQHFASFFNLHPFLFSLSATSIPSFHRFYFSLYFILRLLWKISILLAILYILHIFDMLVGRRLNQFQCRCRFFLGNFYSFLISPIWRACYKCYPIYPILSQFWSSS